MLVAFVISLHVIMTVKIRHNHVTCLFAALLVFSTVSVLWLQRKGYHDPVRSKEYHIAKVDLEYKKKLDWSGLINNRFRDRQKRLRKACRKFSNFDKNGDVFRPEDVLYVPYYNVSICVIQKVGCRFLWKVLEILQKNTDRNNSSEPYRLSNLTGHLKSSFKRSLKIVFTREPYSRLLAAYVDKFLSPNPFFRETGKIIIKRFRHNASNQSLKCGHDVSFQEFVKYVLEDEEVYDPHFTPIHRHCEFCKHKYDVIGKMETFREDISFILYLINASNITKLSEFVHSNYILKEIRVNTKNLFLKRKRMIKSCMTMREALQRLWKRWKIRGFISNDQHLNLSAEESEKMSFFTFYDLALQAVNRSTTLTRQATVYKLKQEYFSSLSINERMSLKQMFRPEFEMFGYNPEPSFVFPLRK